MVFTRKHGDFMGYVSFRQGNLILSLLPGPQRQKWLSDVAPSDGTPWNISDPLGEKWSSSTRETMIPQEIKLHANCGTTHQETNALTWWRSRNDLRYLHHLMWMFFHQLSLQQISHWQKSESPNAFYPALNKILVLISSTRVLNQFIRDMFLDMNIMCPGYSK